MNNDSSLECSSYYAAGFCEGWLTHFARQTQQSQLVLADRVSELLSAVGQRAADQMSNLRRDSAKLLEERRPEVEVAVRPRSKTSRGKAVRGKSTRKGRMSAEGRASLSRSMKAQWRARKAKGHRSLGSKNSARTYWSRMTKAQRSEEMRRRAALAQRNKQKEAA